jgi:hypothetical protein
MRNFWRRSPRIVHPRQDEAVATIASLPCSECGQPAVSWNYVSRTLRGQQVIDGSPVCAEHVQLPKKPPRSRVDLRLTEEEPREAAAPAPTGTGGLSAPTQVVCSPQSGGVVDEALP